MIFWIFFSKGRAEESEPLHSNYTTTLIKGLSSVLIEIAYMDLPLCDPHKGLWVRVPVCHHQLLCTEQWDRRGKASHPGLHEPHVGHVTKVRIRVLKMAT